MALPFSKPALLPSEDPRPELRAEAIRASRRDHVWDWSWPPGCATLRKVPNPDRYPIDFIALTAKLQLEVTANHLAVTIDGTRRLPTLPAPPTSADDLFKNFFSAAEHFQQGAPTTRPATPDDYALYFNKLPVPPLVTRLQQHPDEADLLFAWQRVAGANPMSLHRVTRLPDDLPVTPAHWSRAFTTGSLAEALDAGRLFALDYTALHGAPCNRYLDRQKYLFGARALFSSHTGPLLPLAIQLSPGDPVYTPADGAAWAMARYCLNVADANIHETMEHLGRTHMVIEAVAVALRRNVADAHPLRRLLEPHIAGTFAINESAKTSLIAPEGVIDRVFSARIDVAASLVRLALDDFSLQDRAPSRELRDRGVDDRETLPEYPYRDDVAPLYAAIERFVTGYVQRFYPTDAAVSADPELRAWVDEVASPIGGALRNVRPVETVAGLVEWVTNVIHLASEQHAAVNFPQYPYFGYGASVAGACWGPGPRGAESTDADLLALMPPWDCLMLQADTVYQLSGIHYTRLGDYPRLGDDRADALARAFRDELASLDKVIADADAEGKRRLPYPFLRPSQVPASINI